MQGDVVKSDAAVAQDWIATAAAALDVRPTLAEGGEPFVAIMEAAATVPAGQSLVLVAPFEPAPLYGALGAQGFTHETQRLAADEWVVRFTRAQ
ncbi:MAG TPA: DUF2249 domain-containing protein [Ktedonobacterales bacterium]|jgi:hypothetical protein|nr:DUF2249 domain-containing protein [Ktedonobacterales bacterium]